MRNRKCCVGLLLAMTVFDWHSTNSAAQEPGGRIFHAPSGIASDCSIDVTPDLDAWIASVPDGATLMFASTGCYNIDSGLVITDRHGLTFDGNQSTFRVVSRGSPNRSNWTIRAGSDITLRNMVARGANPKAGLSSEAYDGQIEWQHAYRFQATQTATLDNVQAYDVYGDFVEAEPDWTRPLPADGVAPPARNITVRRSRFERNGRMGMGLTHVDGFVVEDSYIGDVHMTAIDVELDFSKSSGKNIRILRNKFGRVQHALLASAGQGTSESVGNVTFSGNEMLSGPVSCLPPIYVQTPAVGVFWTNFLFENNSLKSYGNGFDLNRLKDVTIRNNSLEWIAGGGCSRDALVRTQDSHDGLVTRNTVTNAPRSYTIFQTDSLSTHFSVSSNTINR